MNFMSQNGDDGNSATEGGSGQNTQVSFEDAFSSYETTRLKTSVEDDTTGAAADKATLKEAEDDSLFESSEDSDTKGDEETDDEADSAKAKKSSKSDESDDDESEPVKKKESEKKKADDPDASGVDKSKKKDDKDGEEDEDEEGDKSDRATHHASLKAKATEYDQLEEKYSDIGGVKGFEDFADLIRAYKDPAKVDDFLVEIEDLAPAHRNAIVTKIFYNALDVPENQVEAINDALLAIGETSDIAIGAKHLIQTPDELQKVIGYIAYMLEDDRDDFFETIERIYDRIDFSEDGKAKAPAKKEGKTERKQQSDVQNPAEQFQNDVASYESYTKSVLDEEVTPILESRGFKTTTKDPVALAKAKTRMTAMIRDVAKIEVMKTSLGEEVINHLSGLTSTSDKPSAIVKNVASRYRTAIGTTAKRILDDIAPAMRGVTAKKAKEAEKVDEPEKQSEGSEKIITNQADKNASLESDDKSKIDWRTDKDPFATNLARINKRNSP